MRHPLAPDELAAREATPLVPLHLLGHAARLPGARRSLDVVDATGGPPEPDPRSAHDEEQPDRVDLEPGNGVTTWKAMPTKVYAGPEWDLKTQLSEEQLAALRDRSDPREEKR